MLEIYNQYPVCELIVHARTGKEMYRGEPHLDVYGYVTENTKIPLCYNGNVCTRADASYIADRFPSTKAIMIGRGLLVNPALLSDEKVTRSLMHDFHEDLVAHYSHVLGSDHAVTGRMKEIWLLMNGVFDADKKYIKRLQLSKTLPELQGAVMALICEAPIKNRSEFDLQTLGL